MKYQEEQAPKTFTELSLPADIAVWEMGGLALSVLIGVLILVAMTW